MTRLYSVVWRTGTGGGITIGMPLVKAVEFAEQKADEGFRDIRIEPARPCTVGGDGGLYRGGGGGGGSITITLEQRATLGLSAVPLFDEGREAGKLDA